jgi:hypothetical protein
LMREAIAFDHLMDVGASGDGEICVPLERGEFFSGAFVIDGVEKKFFVEARSLLRKSFRGKNEKRKQQRKKNRPEHFCGHL